ncbi:type II toxin-antitoxin system HicB family antitoxin [Moorellaceae bacterium AZ2]
MRFTAVVAKEGQWYVARAVEVEVASQGRTIEEALVNLKEALLEPIIAAVEVAL